MTRYLNHLPFLTAILVATAGFMSLAQVLSVHIHHHQFGRIDDSLLPITAAQSSRLLVLGIGLLLLYLSLQIWRRKRLAWQLVMAGVLVLFATELLEVHNTVQLVIYAVLLGLLAATGNQYTVESSNLSLKRGVLTSAAIIAVVFIYATVGFAQLGRHEVGADVSLPSSAKYAAREVFTFQETQLPLRSRHARWFVASVNAASVVGYTLAIFSLFRPLRFQYGPTRAERERARAILGRYSRDTEDFFKLWPPDKHFFFSASGNAFIAYKVTGSDAMVLGGPSGDRKDFKELSANFDTFAGRNGWTPTYIYADAALEKVLDDKYNRLFIGNEALLDIPVFASDTSRNKHFRYVRNKAERDGLQFDYWPAPLSEEQLDQMAAISDAWLSSGGRREYTYAMGYFDREYLRGTDVAVLTRAGRLEAYANLVPAVGASPNRSIDHMRHRPGMPSTGMHFLLMQLIIRLNESGAKGFNLGLVPLSGIEERIDANTTERILSVFKKVSSRYYSSEGLEQFKNKFDPDWQPRYLYYQGPPPRLVKVAGSLNRVLSLPVAGRATRRVMVGLSVIAGLCYSSFFLAFLLSPRHYFSGFVSELGAAGHSYAGLYNGLDAAAGVLLLGILGYLWRWFSEEIQPYRQPVILFAVAALGVLLAALAPLPHRHLTVETQTALHAFFSFLVLLYTFLAGLWFTKLKRHWWPTLLTVIYFISLAGWGLTRHVSPLGPILQCINVAATSLWMVTLVVYLTGVIKPRIKV